jgi:outer membrane immunogenic protein
MLRKIILSSVAATALVGSALAADLPRRAPPPAYVPPPPVLTWQGFYVGVNGGAIWSNSRTITTTGTNFGVPFAPLAPVSAAAALSVTNTFGNNNNNNNVGFLGGGQWGYNWQWNQVVLGTESDFQGTVNSCRNDNNNNGFFFGGNDNGCVVHAVGIAPIGATGLRMLGLQSVDRRMDYFGTSRVRAGYLVTPTFLLYGTGGVAYGHIRTTSTVFTSVLGAPAGLVIPGVSVYNDSRIKAGWTAGGGIEWMFLPNWSVKAEALYYDLGRTTFNQNFVQTLGARGLGIALSNTGTQTTFRNNGVIARAGINYHFSWGAAPAPVVARY